MLPSRRRISEILLSVMPQDRPVSCGGDLVWVAVLVLEGSRRERLIKVALGLADTSSSFPCCAFISLKGLVECLKIQEQNILSSSRGKFMHLYVHIHYQNFVFWAGNRRDAFSIVVLGADPLQSLCGGGKRAQVLQKLEKVRSPAPRMLVTATETTEMERKVYHRKRKTLVPVHTKGRSDERDISNTRKIRQRHISVED